MDEEELMMQALEAGAEDFNSDVDTCEIISAPENFSRVRQTLEEAGIEMLEAGDYHDTANDDGSEGCRRYCGNGKFLGYAGR